MELMEMRTPPTMSTAHMMTEEDLGYVAIALIFLLVVVWPLVVWIWMSGSMRRQREATRR